MNKYLIIAPCFNEHLVIAKFLDELEQKLKATNDSFVVIIVDDGSNDSTIEVLSSYQFTSEKFELKVIGLKFNMGHQEAIRQGLIYSKNLQLDIDGVVVMDSDGEDDPNAIVELIQFRDSDIVFVQRGKRKENLQFKTGYFFYRHLFRAVTGKKIAHGNYSFISPKVLDAIAYQSFIHYAGFLSKQKFNIENFQYDRQKRIDGKSKMNYKNLVFHGLYSLVEYAEEILFSLIKLFGLIFISLIFIGTYVLYSKFISHNAISGWTSAIGANLVISSLVIISTIIIGLLLLSIKKSIHQKNEQYYEIS